MDALLTNPETCNFYGIEEFLLAHALILHVVTQILLFSVAAASFFLETIFHENHKNKLTRAGKVLAVFLGLTLMAVGTDVYVAHLQDKTDKTIIISEVEEVRILADSLKKDLKSSKAVVEAINGTLPGIRLAFSDIAKEMRQVEQNLQKILKNEVIKNLKTHHDYICKKNAMDSSAFLVTWNKFDTLPQKDYFDGWRNDLSAKIGGLEISANESSRAYQSQIQQLKQGLSDLQSKLAIIQQNVSMYKNSKVENLIPTVQLQEGSVGVEVRMLQDALNFAGYKVSESTGFYKTETKEAVLALRRDFKIDTLNPNYDNAAREILYKAMLKKLNR